MDDVKLELRKIELMFLNKFNLMQKDSKILIKDTKAAIKKMSIIKKTYKKDKLKFIFNTNIFNLIFFKHDIKKLIKLYWKQKKAIILSKDALNKLKNCYILSTVDDIDLNSYQQKILLNLIKFAKKDVIKTLEEYEKRRNKILND